MSQSTLHHFGASDDDDRRSRFASPPGLEDVGKNQNGGFGIGGAAASLRERAASQPPRRSSEHNSFFSSPSATHFIPSSLGGGTASQWPSSRFVPPNPIRSASYTTPSQSQFSAAMRERVFPSTYEDDESEDTLSDSHDDILVPPSLGRGRSYGQDPTRSRSQSLATNSRPDFLVGSYFGRSAMDGWNDTLHSNSTSSPLAIPGRYGEIKPPGPSRYGSLGTVGRSPSNYFSSSPSNNLLGSDLATNRFPETNQSPFRRDVGKILLDDGSAFRELWAGANPPRDENGGGGSGTTSRRHSVSVVQPRKGIIGFNASRAEGSDDSTRATNTFVHLSNEELASDLGMLNLNPNEPSSLASSSNHPPSQPASLPIYAPLSRSPPTRDLLSQYQNMTLNIQSSYVSRQQIGTPTESELSAGGSSPTKNSPFEQFQQDTTARFIPGQGFNYPPTGDMGAGNVQLPYLRHRQASFTNSNVQPALTSPISPLSAGGSRLMNPQQQPYYAQPIQRRPSEPQTPLSTTSTHIPQPSSASINLKNPPLPQHAPHQGSQQQQHQQAQQGLQQPNLNDLGKGVPLHSVPPSCPLFIIEFKAGRTDLFYLIDPSMDVKINDLVIVEADRGKDLGKIINDTITIEEVEAWQRQQAEQAAAAAASAAAGMGYAMEGPLSPGGSAQGGQQGGSGGQQQQQPMKKDINPKMILAKADQQDIATLTAKAQDELKALQLCRSKVKAKKLPMEVIDAEYQWDRRKLTFYFIAEKRIDFRELVRELFRLYKTRIWMASVQSGIAYEQ